MSLLSVVGVSHLTASVGIRERVAFTSAEATAALEALRTSAGIKEAVLLSTCNRTEFYLYPGSDLHVEAAEAELSKKAG